jgi:hypothetical protein
MAATISENYLSRAFTLGTQVGRELVYDIRGATDEAAALTILAATAPAVYLYLTLDTLSAEPLGYLVWKGYARYTRYDAGNEFTFDTTGGSQKITQSLATINSYAPSGLTAPNFGGAIGVSDDRVEGVDKAVPAYAWTETHYFASGAVDGTYRRTLIDRTGTVNNATFKGFAAGECLFLGAAGAQRGDERWAITFRFAGSPNATGLTVGTITGIAKLGWDYLWVRYGDFEDATAYALVKRPVAAYVERIYTQADFSSLNIGTT